MMEMNKRRENTGGRSHRKESTNKPKQNKTKQNKTKQQKQLQLQLQLRPTDLQLGNGQVVGTLGTMMGNDRSIWK